MIFILKRNTISVSPSRYHCISSIDRDMPCAVAQFLGSYPHGGLCGIGKKAGRFPCGNLPTLGQRHRIRPHSPVGRTLRMLVKLVLIAISIVALELVLNLYRLQKLLLLRYA